MNKTKYFGLIVYAIVIANYLASINYLIEK